MLAKLKKPILYLLVLYALFGFIALPLLVKSELKKIIEQETYSKVTIGDVSFNPFLFKFSLKDVNLESLDAKPLITFRELHIDVVLSSLLRGAVHLQKLELSEPVVSLVYNNDKSINILNILKESTPVKEEEKSDFKMPRVIIGSIEIIDGKVAYEDYTQATPFEFSFENIGFVLKDIDTDDFNSSDATLRLYTTLGDGGFVDFKSNLVGFKPLIVEGSLDFEASKLYTQWKYAQDMLNLEVADGKISFHAGYYLNVEDLNHTRIDNLNVSLEKLRIKPKNKFKDVLNLDSFYVKNTTILPLQRRVLVDKIALYDLSIKAQRDSNGTIDWLEYIKVDTPTQTQSDENTTKVSSEPWDVVLKELSLEKIALNFKDEAIQPSVTSSINPLNIYANDITLKGEKPFHYNIDILLNQAGKCALKGDVKHSQLDINSHIECKGFDIVHYNPYIDAQARKALKRYNIKLNNAIAGFDADVNIRAKEDDVAIKISDSNVSIDKLKVATRNDGKSLTGFENFNIDGINVNSEDKNISIDKVSLNLLYVNLEKNRDKTLNIDDLVVARPTKKAKQTNKEEPFAVNVKHFALKNSRVGFTDKSLKKKTTNKIDRIYANAYNIDLKKYSWLTYNLFMRVNKKGTIKAQGALRHTPLKQRGTFNINKLSLTELTPYLQEKAYVSVDDGKLSLKGKVAYQQSSKKPDLRVQGSVNLASLFVNDTQDDSLLLSLSDVGVKSYTLELFPNRLYIDEVDIDSFFVNAIIDANKTMNFSKLMIKSDVNESDTTVEEESMETNSSFPVRIVKINYALGSAKFADYSIPIEFKTHIHDLNGLVYSISNMPGDTTYVDITGEVDEYGSTKLKGSIDSANPKNFTDLDFNFQNLDLNSFSGYSASFAGHEIDSGKLYLDLGYDILNSQLNGKNVVMIKQIKLGKEIEDENVTKLPLGFVIGLLEDNDGVIDINMPVEGNLDEPDFKYGRLVLQTIGNLITKAVTSPFQFLGSVMGMDTDDLEYVSFAPASTLITPPEREKLDSIVKIMLKKPKIVLSVAGGYNTIVDKQGMQRNKLIDLVVLKSGIKNIKDHKSVMTTDMLEDIYEEIRDDDLLDQTKDKLSATYEDEEFDRAYQNELIRLCTEIQVISEDELKLLAQNRAKKIITYLTQEKGISLERIDNQPIVISDNKADETVKTDMQIEVK